MTQRPRRRWWKILLVIIVLLVVLVAAAPMILSAGPAAGIVAGVLREQVNGTADVQAVKLSWFGDQRIEGLVLADETGETNIDLTLHIGKGLLGLAFGGGDALTIDCTGAIKVALRADGSTSVQPMFEKNPPSPPKPKPADEPLTLAGLPALKFATRDLVVQVNAEGRSVQLDGVNANLSYLPGGTTTLTLASKTTSDNVHGDIDVSLTAERLVAADGAVTPKGAAVHVTITANSMPVPGVEQLERVNTVTITADTDDLTGVIDVTVNGDARLEGGAASTLTATLGLREIIGADGKVLFAPERVTGNIKGIDVPTGLIQPLLSATPVLAARDIGPTMTLTATFSEGADKRITLDIESEPRTNVHVSATVTPQGALRDGTMTSRMTLQPELATAVPYLSAASAVAVELTLDSFSVPARTSDGSLAIADITARGRLTVADGLRVADPQRAEQALPLSDVSLSLDAPRLGDGVHVTANALLGSSQLSIDERITGLLAADGTVTADKAAPIGTLKVSGIDAALAAAFLDDATLTRAKPLLGKPATLTVTTSDEAGSLRAVASLEAEAVTAGATIVRGTDALRASDIKATVKATPQLLSAMQITTDDGAQLAAPATLVLKVEPMEFRGATFSDYDFAAAPIKASLSSSEMRIAHGSLAEPLVLRELNTTFGTQPATVAGAAIGYTVGGGAILSRKGADAKLADLALDLRGTTAATIPSGTVTLEDLDVTGFEKLSGLAAGRLTGWVGPRGRVALGLEGAKTTQVTVDVALPRLSGKATVAMKDDMLTATTQQMRMTIAAATLERSLNPPDEDGTPVPDPLRVLEDMTCTLVLTACTVPTAMFTDQPFDTTAVDIDADFSGGPLVLANSEGAQTRLSDVKLTAKADDFAEGLTFTLDGTVPAGAAGKGTIDVDGTVKGLMNEAGAFDTTAARVDMTANVAQMPTIIADAFLGLKGLLVAALGPEMNAAVTSRNFSRFRGRMDVKFTTPNGFLEGQLRGIKNSLRTTDDDPLRAELAITPPLREQLLANVHPVLADVETTEQPVRVRFTSPTVFPLDGDMGRLKGDLEITIGKVKFKSGDLTLNVLSFFSAGKGERFGEIEPIIVHIKKGVVTYERFAMKIDKYTLVYEGSVDLVKQQVDLKTTIPLAALAQTFNELEGYADKIMVPLVTRGPLGKTKTQIDPDFDLAGAALKAGAGGALDGLLKGKGADGLGGVLGDLLGGGKKDEGKDKGGD